VNADQNWLANSDVFHPSELYALLYSNIGWRGGLGERYKLPTGVCGKAAAEIDFDAF